ncbi:unnamed protein product, partial [Hydatigera taeniaeformis]|uniref:Tetraspanin n=1 Tax=Hydatigena taeniaeformis TaxID=6205 RepID=A0A0R3XAU5_HYDTA
MGCALSCSLKFVLQIFNAILCVIFLVVGIFGIVLVSSKSAVQSLLENVFDLAKVEPGEMQEFVQFITENISGVAYTLISVGFFIALLCLFGFISSCCGYDLLLKIYCALLVAILSAQLIAVAVVFATPDRMALALVNSTNELLPLYGNTTRPEEAAASAIWNAIMKEEGPAAEWTASKISCALIVLLFAGTSKLPVECCGSDASTCSPERARTAKIPG